MIQSLSYITVTPRECEQCAFVIHVPRVDFSHPILCPRCWTPFLSEEKYDRAGPHAIHFSTAACESVQPVESGYQLTNGRQLDLYEPPIRSMAIKPKRTIRIDFASVPTDQRLPESEPPEVEAESAIEQAETSKSALPKVSPSLTLVEDQEERKPLSYRERFRQSVASYGVSFCVHAFLLFLAALIVFSADDFLWHNSINASLNDGEEVMAFENLEDLQLPVNFEAPLQIESVTSIASVTELPIEITAVSVTGSDANRPAGSPGNDGKGEVGFFGTKASGKSFSFVVDISGSMASPFSQTDFQPGQPIGIFTRWHKAREELLSAVNSMSTKQLFSVCLYDNGTYLCPLNSTRSGLVPATKRNKQALKDWLYSMQGGGGTDPRYALQGSLSFKPEVLFFLTDGIIPPDTREVAKTSNLSETVIHTTCIGFDDNEVLRQIAEDHRGRFRGIVGQNVTGFRNVNQLGSPATPVHEITLVCLLSETSSMSARFRKLEKQFKSLEEHRNAGHLPFGRAPQSLLVLHNAASEVPEFNHELQLLLKKLHTRAATGFREEIYTGRIGVGLPLDVGMPDEFLKNLPTIHEQTATTSELLKTFIPDHKLNNSRFRVSTIYLMGSYNAKQEIIAAFEVYNLFNGSTITVMDGDELFKE